MTTTPDPARIGCAVTSRKFTFTLGQTAVLLIGACATPRHPDTGDFIETTWRELNAAHPELVDMSRRGILDVTWLITVAEIQTEGTE